MAEPKTEVERLDQQKTQNNKLKADQRQQLEKDGKFKTITANKDSKFQINETDKGHIILYVSVRNLDEATKTYKDDWRLLPIWPRQLKQMIADGAFLEFDDVRIIHVPEGVDLDLNVPLKVISKTSSGPSANTEADLRDREAKLEQREKSIKDEMDAMRAQIAMLTKTEPPAK